MKDVKFATSGQYIRHGQEQELCQAVAAVYPNPTFWHSSRIYMVLVQSCSNHLNLKGTFHLLEYSYEVKATAKAAMEYTDELPVGCCARTTRSNADSAKERMVAVSLVQNTGPTASREGRVVAQTERKLDPGSVVESMLAVVPQLST